MEKIQKPKNNQISIYIILSSLIYAVCLVVIKKMDPSKTLGIMISLIPTITFILFIKNFIKNINLMDEVEKRIQLEATVWAFCLGLLFLMTLSLLDTVVTLKKEHWDISFIIPFFFIFHALGTMITRRKYNQL